MSICPVTRVWAVLQAVCDKEDINGKSGAVNFTASFQLKTVKQETENPTSERFRKNLECNL